jgi:2-dehydropantoate 2-reductase
VNSSTPRIALLGAGSIGTILAAYISKEMEIDIIDTNAEHVEALNSSGAQVTGKVNFTQKVSAYLPSKLPKNHIYDLVILLVKQMHTEVALQGIAGHVNKNTVYLTLQNGIPEIELISRFGNTRVLGATVNWGASYRGPGVSELTSDPTSLSFTLGRYDGEDSVHIDMAQRVLSSMCPTERTKTLQASRWVKLLSNAGLSSLSTIIGGTFGDVLDNRVSRVYLQYLLREIATVAHAVGVGRLEHNGKNLTPLLMFSGEFSRKLKTPIIKIAYKPHRALEASMLQDVRAGRKTEVDAITGVVSAQGKQHGVPTPFSDQAIAIIKDIEGGVAKPGIENLERLQMVLFKEQGKKATDVSMIPALGE